MQSMDGDAREELTRLRRRAYGPDADIDGDPDALARLRELEALARAEDLPSGASASETLRRRSRAGHTGAPVPAERGTQAPDRWTAAIGLDDGVAAEAAEAAASAELAASVTPALPAPPGWTPPRIGRALLIGWAASLVVVAVVVGALVFGLASLRPVSAETGARQVASLAEPMSNPLGAEGGFGSSERTAYYDYAGLVIVVAEDILGPTAMGSCLVITSEAAMSGEDSSRPSVPGCGAAPFPPTVSLVVERNSPESLRAAFPVGTSLQFVWDGTAVAVFAADPPEPTDAPA